MTSPRSAPATARGIARRELTLLITEEARRQLADHGADGLSLRAVARALGMASSAMYRYFPSRDEMLTTLIVQSYSALGDAIEAADQDGVVPSARFRRMCRAARQWAIGHPHEYALLYGSPVPGYRAPRDTVDPAARIPLALLAPVRDGWTAGQVRADGRVPMPPPLAEQLSPVIEQIAPGLPPAIFAAALAAWTRLFGLISFELFGHLVGSADPADEFFEYEIGKLAIDLGLEVGQSRTG